MAAPTISGLAAVVDSLLVRVAALEAIVITNETKIKELDMSDEASGWKRWRENRSKEGS